MSYRLPRVASTATEASLPPAGLDGLDVAFSRLVRVPERPVGHTLESTLRRGTPFDELRDRTEHVWHVLDNAGRLDELGIQPVGTILCVHGNPTWSYLWRQLVTAATDQATDAAANGRAVWRVIAVDQLDMGFSERTGVQRPLARRVQDLADFTAAIGLDTLARPVVTFGHDWGGVVSLGWAVDHQELLAGVMLLNTAVHQPHDVTIPAPLRLALKRSVLAAATVTTPAFLETTLALAHPSLPASVKNGYRAPYRQATRRGGIGAFVVDIPANAEHPSLPELDRIADGVRALGTADNPMPALMLWGPRDPIFSDRYLDDLSERMPHADIHRFEGAGHLVAEDRDYASAALTWLDDRAASGVLRTTERVSAAARQAATGEAAASTSQPLWHHLDTLRDSDETALIEMVPPTGGAPRVVSWQLLSRRVRQIAAGLGRVGVTKGDRVSLLVPPGADLTAVLYACVRIGAVVVVADAGLGLRGLTRAVRGARPDHVIGALPGLAAARVLGWPGQKISTVRFPRVTARALGVAHALADIATLGADEQLPAVPRPDDAAAVLFTSGSTGPAKGVVYTHAQLSAVCTALSAQYGIGVGTGLVAGFAPFALLGPALGASSVTPDMDVTSPKTLTAVAVAAAVAAIDASVVFLSPAALSSVVATADDLTPDDRAALSGVQTFLSAGAPISEQQLTAAANVMPNASAHTPYGMTEGLLMTDISLEGIREALHDSTSADGDSVGLSDGLVAGGAAGGVCVGTPAATTHVRISALDRLGQAVGFPSDAPDITGEIVVSAPHIKDHYDRLWLTNRAAEHGTVSDTTVSDTTGQTSSHRWHRTGDVGHLDARGRLWIEGRLPHVITAADGVVTPVGPEQRIESVSALKRAAVVGVGPAGTQQLVAVIETTDAATRVSLADSRLASAVRAAVDRPLAAILVVPRLPTDIRHNSKIDRTLLSGWASRILAGGRMRRP